MTPEGIIIIIIPIIIYYSVCLVPRHLFRMHLSITKIP